MGYKTFDSMKNGEICDFVQIYISNLPIILCTSSGHIREKRPLDVSNFLDSLLRDSSVNELKRENFIKGGAKLNEDSLVDLVGYGRVAKDSEGILRVWNVPNSEKYHLEHLINYQKANPLIKIVGV